MSNLSLLFQRPLESIFFAKDNGKKKFDLPADFLTERYKDTVVERSNVAKYITVKDIVKPDLSFADGLTKYEAFSLFLSKHTEISTKLTQLFLDQVDVDTLMAVACYCRDRVNVFLFQYSFSCAIQHRPDTKNVDIPSALELFPDQFMDASVKSRFLEEGKLEESQRVSVL